jgi:hypothetical protein
VAGSVVLPLQAALMLHLRLDSVVSGLLMAMAPQRDDSMRAHGEVVHDSVRGCDMSAAQDYEEYS